MAKRTRTVKKTTSPTAPSSSSRSTRTVLLYGLLLLVAAVATYYPARSHPFLDFDDSKYVTLNSNVQAGLSWNTVQWAFTTYYASNWHPLTWLSHALDWQMFGPDPAGPHEINVLFHVVDVLLLFWVLERATGMAGRSAMAAGLFALHPINVETVAWVAERKNLLSMLFLLLALAAYRWYAKQPRAGPYVLVTVLFILGLMAKPQIITLPFLLLLWDYWPLERMSLRADGQGKQAVLYPPRSFVQLVVEKIPLFVISAVSAVVTVKAQAAGHAVQSLGKFPFGLRLENAIISYARYLAKAFWPSPLSPFYPFSRSAPPVWQLLAALAVLLAICWLVAAGRRYRYLTVGWLWFLGTLVPMIGLMQVGVQAMADRYAYLSFIGLFVMVCWGVADLADARHLSRAWATGVSVALLLVLAVVTRHQLAYWSDEETLWIHAIQVTTGNYVAEDNLGTTYLDRQELDEAAVHFRRAIAIEPHDGLGYLNVGVYEQRSHHWPEAVAAYKEGISNLETVDMLSRAYSNLGFVYYYSGDTTSARDSFQHAVDLAPDTEQAWLGLGIVAQKSGDLPDAIQQYSRAIQARPSGLGYLLLARALHKSGRSEEAEAALQTARHFPGNFSATQQVADALVGR
ncbi:MAG: tetratricopeptide repeat protein [Candidatus Korobacteraceae bacterium]